MNLLTGSCGKLAEARFFLALLKRIEDDKPVTAESLDDEATYFMSALLNGCYSVLEYLESEGKRALRSIDSLTSKASARELEDEIKDFRNHRNSDLYKNKYGLRHLSVHHEIVKGKHDVQTHGGWGTARWGTTRCGASTTSCRLYVDGPRSQEPLWIVSRMTDHVRELEKLIAYWENRIEASGSHLAS